jgi:hypothetical protein
MTLFFIPDVNLKEDGAKSLSEELEYALAHCYDLPELQSSSLTKMPAVLDRARDETGGLELAKALRKELIDCAAQLTQRPVYPLEDLFKAIENGQPGIASQTLERVKGEIGVPFSRNRIDLARFYAIRLVMQGFDHESIANFLEVDPRTVGNYLAQARERIRVVLESQEMLDKAFGLQGVHG